MTVAALYIDPRGPYPKLLGPELCWDEGRDARTYAGPWPVVAHPPCGPWGRLRHLYKGTEHDCALVALAQVRVFGGVLEHPAESKLWHHDRELRGHLGRFGSHVDAFGGRSAWLDQVEWGHVARKRTWLYMVGVPLPYRFLAAPFPGRKPTHQVSRDAKRARRNSYTLKRTSAQMNRRTPVAFAEWLISLAEQAGRRAAAE